MTGKPNQKVPVAPLQPIAAVTTPFSHLTIDCVGPLPRSKAGHAYLLTVMCQTTRYPAAFPLRSITSKAILKALTSFMSILAFQKPFSLIRVRILCPETSLRSCDNLKLNITSQVLITLKVKEVWKDSLRLLSHF